MFRINSVTGLLLTLILLLVFTECQQDQDTQVLPKTVDFNFHIKPILSDRCFTCHGPDENKRKAKLALHTEETAFAELQENEGHFAIVPGRLEESEIFHRINSIDPEVMMPPPESNLSLSEYEKKLIAKWISQGAKWKEHWSFIPPQKPDLPKVKNEDWCSNPVDYFILQKMSTHRLQPSSEATKEQLIRRLSFDLTGLPPSLEEIDAFLADDSPDAYEKQVDRLLASPHFGERMASMWLDVARYADSHGYQDDKQRTMWPWRDWVVKVFNDNLPYDQFVTWQVAGDLLPEASYEQKLATGFNRNHAITQEGGVVPEEYLAEYAADRSQTFSTAFLGLTMECARCHSHKYDPITQEEYYGMFAFFNNVKAEQAQINYFDLSPQPNLQILDPLMDSTAVQVKQMIQGLESKDEALKAKPSEAFRQWLKKDYASNSELGIDLEKGLLAYFTMDQTEQGKFLNKATESYSGLLNINLPPEIERPELVTGKTSNALRFNGTNFLSLGELGDFAHTDHFSFGAWVNPGPGREKQAVIVARRNGEQKQSGYELVLTPSNQIAIRLIHQWQGEEKLDLEKDFAIELRTVTRVPNNQWSQIYVTYEGTGKAAGFKIYLNGQQQTTNTVLDNLQGQSILNGNDFLVGNWNHRAKEKKNLYGFKNGVIDEVRVYNRTLTPLEIKSLYNGNIQPATKQEQYLHYLQKFDNEYLRNKLKLDSLRAIDLETPKVMIMAEMDTVKKTFVLNRGKYDEPIKEIQRVTPAKILQFPDKYPSNRLGLTQWLFDEENPLTSRVMVNRFWQLIFGKGLVRTPEDFGNQGALPSHPELLDWLAVNFRETGWDMKALLKTMVMSSTYRQSAKMTKEKLRIDSDNKWLSRGPSVRLSAEMFRDQALAASGLLNNKVGGKWVRPYQPAGIWKEMANQIGENKYRPSKGADLYRRSLYSYWKRTIPPPSMLIFDAAERVVCTVKRQETSTPLQSLNLLNNPTYVEASRKLAEGLLQSNDVNVEQNIARGFRKITSRHIEEPELKLLMDLYEVELTRFEQNLDNAAQLLQVGDATVDPALPTNKLAAFTVVMNTIFNMDESKYK